MSCGTDPSSKSGDDRVALCGGPGGQFLSERPTVDRSVASAEQGNYWAGKN